jgi:hypothetical protein
MGRNLSEPQKAAVEILVHLEAEAEDAQRIDAIKRSLLTARPDLAPLLWPEYVSPIVYDEIDLPEDDVALDQPGAVYDYSGVQFTSPKDMDETQFADLEQLLANQNITVRETPGAPEEVREELGFSLEPDDAEWT